MTALKVVYLLLDKCMVFPTVLPVALEDWIGEVPTRFIITTRGPLERTIGPPSSSECLVFVYSFMIFFWGSFLMRVVVVSLRIE